MLPLRLATEYLAVTTIAFKVTGNHGFHRGHTISKYSFAAV